MPRAMSILEMALNSGLEMLVRNTEVDSLLHNQFGCGKREGGGICFGVRFQLAAFLEYRSI